MKDKNLPDDIKAKSLEELREILNSKEISNNSKLKIDKITKKNAKEVK